MFSFCIFDRMSLLHSPCDENLQWSYIGFHNFFPGVDGICMNDFVKGMTGPKTTPVLGLLKKFSVKLYMAVRRDAAVNPLFLHVIFH